MIFAPSKYQQDIYDFVQKSLSAPEYRQNLIISAVAGSGKSTTIKELLRVIPTHMSVLYLTFMREVNLDLGSKVNAMKDELNGACPKAEVRTCHSIGNGCLKDIGIKGDPSKNGRKYNRLCQTWLRNHMAVYNYKASEQLAKLVDKVRVTLAGTDEDSLLNLLDRYDIDLDPSDKNVWPLVLMAVPEILAAGIDLARRENIFDFTDQIWLPSSKALNLQPDRYDVVMIDEAQDLSPCIRELSLKAAKRDGMVISVGDRRQCQPAGTMVRLSDGLEKPIEQLKPGDTVYSFDRRSSAYVRTGLVTETASRPYKGLLYTVQAGGKESQCTDSHKWLVRWVDGENAYVTYLMRKGNSYRVGQTQMFMKRPNRGIDFGLAFRAKHEKADAAWILKVHSTRHEALVYEQVLSASYGIPELCFDAHNLTVFTQEMIDKVYSLLPEQEKRARLCLEDHGRKLEYPLYVTEGMNGYYNDARQQRQGRTTLFETQACNLIPDYMAIPVAPDTIRAVHDKLHWETINVTTEKYNGLVYSLNIERHHKYIADGLLTCNCIMGFAGASYHSLDEIKEATHAVELPLNKNYRCPESVIKLAQTLVPEIEAWEGAQPGEVNHIYNGSIADLAQAGDMILCRWNAPLVGMAIDLIRMRKRCIVKGKDLGGDVTAFLDRIVKFYQEQVGRSFYPDMLFTDLYKYTNEYQSRMLAIYQQDEEANEGKINKLDDNTATLLALYEGYQEELADKPDYESFKAFITDFFTEHGEAKGEIKAEARRYTITLSTGHKAKGLENPNVFVISYDELPSSKAKTAEAKEQEQNLLYVMLTRPQKKLYLGVKDVDLYTDELPEASELIEIAEEIIQDAQIQPVEAQQTVIAPVVEKIPVIEEKPASKRGRKAKSDEEKAVKTDIRLDPSIRAVLDQLMAVIESPDTTDEARTEMVPNSAHKIPSMADVIQQALMEYEPFRTRFEGSQHEADYQERQARKEQPKKKRMQNEDNKGPNDDGPSGLPKERSDQDAPAVEEYPLGFEEPSTSFADSTSYGTALLFPEVEADAPRRTVRVFYHCPSKRCGKDWYADYYVAPDGRRYREENGQTIWYGDDFLKCPYCGNDGRYIKAKPFVRKHSTKGRCDSRCWHAKPGSPCTCTCNGLRHSLGEEGSDKRIEIIGTPLLLAEMK